MTLKGNDISVAALGRRMAQNSPEYRELDAHADPEFRQSRQRQLVEQAERLVYFWLSPSYPHLPSLASRVALTRAMRDLGAEVDEDFFDPRPTVDDLVHVSQAYARARFMKEIEKRLAWVAPGESTGGYYLTAKERKAIGA